MLVASWLNFHFVSGIEPSTVGAHLLLILVVTAAYIIIPWQAASILKVAGVSVRAVVEVRRYKPRHRKKTETTTHQF